MARPTAKALATTMERFIESLLGWKRPERPLLPYSAAASQWMSSIEIFSLTTDHKAVMPNGLAAMRDRARRGYCDRTAQEGPVITPPVSARSNAAGGARQRRSGLRRGGRRRTR